MKDGRAQIMRLWNCCAVCGDRIEVGESCIGLKKGIAMVGGDSICFKCAQIENFPDDRDPVSITELFHKTDAIENIKQSTAGNCLICKNYEADKKRCNHPKINWDVECYDCWIETSPCDFCSYFKPREKE